MQKLVKKGETNLKGEKEQFDKMAVAWQFTYLPH